MKIRDKKLLDTLREGPLSHLSALDFKMIRDAVAENGIDGVSGYAASMIADAKRRMAMDMKKAKQVRVGDMVSWDSSGGSAEGKVLRIENSGRINVPGSSFNIQGEEDDPAVLITLYRDGKPTDTKVGHKMSTLKKKQFFLNTATTTKPLTVTGVKVMTPKAKIRRSQKTTFQVATQSPTRMIPKGSLGMATTIILATWTLWIIQERKPKVENEIDY